MPIWSWWCGANEREREEEWGRRETARACFDLFLLALHPSHQLLLRILIWIGRIGGGGDSSRVAARGRPKKKNHKWDCDNWLAAPLKTGNVYLASQPHSIFRFRFSIWSAPRPSTHLVWQLEWYQLSLSNIDWLFPISLGPLIDIFLSLFHIRIIHLHI